MVGAHNHVWASSWVDWSLTLMYNWISPRLWNAKVLISKGGQSSRLTRWMIVSCITLECHFWTCSISSVAQIAKMSVLTINNAHVQVNVATLHKSYAYMTTYFHVPIVSAKTSAGKFLHFVGRTLSCGVHGNHASWNVAVILFTHFELLHEYLKNFLSWAFKIWGIWEQFE